MGEFGVSSPRVHKNSDGIAIPLLIDQAIIQYNANLSGVALLDRYRKDRQRSTVIVVGIDAVNLRQFVLCDRLSEGVYSLGPTDNIFVTLMPCTWVRLKHT